MNIDDTRRMNNRLFADLGIVLYLVYAPPIKHDDHCLIAIIMHELFSLPQTPFPFLGHAVRRNLAV